MRIKLGYDKDVNQSAVMDDSRLINGHALLVGKSGVGKSYTLRRMMAQAIESSPVGQSVRFHVFDVHGDLAIEGASEVVFSRSGEAGLNPLRVNPDPHFGGVDTCIERFISTINDAAPTKLGVKQVSVVRNLLLDVYRDFGFERRDPGTWVLNQYEVRLLSGGSDNRLYLQVAYEDKDRARAFGARWDPARSAWYVHTQNYRGDIRRFPAAFKAREYPTLTDVIEYAQRIHLERFLGSDQAGVRALREVEQCARKLQKMTLDAARAERSDAPVYSEDDEDAYEGLKETAVQVYAAYVNAVRTGRELESLMKYDSSDVLKSVIDRLQTLEASGLFKAVVAPFDPESPVWRYKVNALTAEGKKMFVFFRMQELLNEAIQAGECPRVRDVIVLDELGTYTSSRDKDGGDGIIGVICREARKFGLALWGATQSPATVPEALISTVATKVLLGVDEMYWGHCVDKLRLPRVLLERIQPHRTLAAQISNKGELKSRWGLISV